MNIMIHDDLPNNAHGSSHQRFTSVHIIGNEVEDVEDGRHILLKGLGWELLVIVTDQKTERNLLFWLTFMAPIIPPQASIIPSRRETT
jgi:hypothetical protein